jgi:ADP-ribosylation factor-like protein 3
MGLLSYLKNLTSRGGPTEVRVLILGLDNSGKSCLLKRLSEEDILDARPTQGFVVKTLKQGSLSINMWDVGGNICIVYFTYFEIL